MISKYISIRMLVAIGATWVSINLAAAQTPPPEMPDFDRTFGFAVPTLATVIRTYSDANLYGIVPNQLDIMSKVGGAPDVSFIHKSESRGGYFTINIEVSINEDKLTAVQDEIKKQNPNARFVILEPIRSEFRITIPGTDTNGALARNVKALGPRRFSATFVVDDIVKRILLLPTSDHFDFFAVSYEGTYRGVIRDQDSNPKIGERIYSIGSTFGGSCAVYPETIVELPSGKEGCQFPKYPHDSVLRIQKGLKKLRFYPNRADGVFGSRTYEAIRNFQKAEGLRPDGIPTSALLQAIDNKALGASL